jgi:hypothetical protein
MLRVGEIMFVGGDRGFWPLSANEMQNAKRKGLIGTNPTSFGVLFSEPRVQYPVEPKLRYPKNDEPRRLQEERPGYV